VSSITRWQPILPAEEPPSKAERAFINDQPVIFPPNQDSNWGVLRKAWTDQLQALINQQTLIWSERFVQTSTTFLDEWEFMAGLPEAPTGISDSERRLRVLNRIRSGPFTDARRIEIIEPYIQATFGVSPAFTPGGLSLSGGIPLMADAAGDPKQYYRVYEDVRNFAYEVWIDSDMTPDLVNMLRDLKRITPAGITITIDNTHAVPLDYAKAIRNNQPIWYGRLGGNANDSSGNANNGTLNGSPATLAAPGLLNSSVAAGDAGITFDGTNDYISIPITALIQRLVDNWTVEFLIKTSTVSRTLISTMAGGLNIRIRSTGALAIGSTASEPLLSSTGVTDNVTHFVVVRRKGNVFNVRIDGVDRSVLNPSLPISIAVPTALNIGRKYDNTEFFNGGGDEFAFFDRYLSDAQVDSDYKTSKAITL
jgi:Concanavalin A-like lectin/glucanases superfamily